VDAFDEPLFVVDEAGTILVANTAARRLFTAERTAPGSELPFPWACGRSQTVEAIDHAGAAFEAETTASRVRWPGRDAWLIRFVRRPSGETSDPNAHRLARLYAALSQTSNAAARSTDAIDLFEDVCRIAVAFAGFTLAWVARPTRCGAEMERVAAAGPSLAYLDALRIRLDPATPEGQGPIARTLRLGVPYVCNAFGADPSTAPWHAIAALHGIASFAVFPIRSAGGVVAVFAVYSKEPGIFGTDLLSLLDRMAGEVSSGLDRQANREARSSAERALAESELRLRQLAAVSDQVFWMIDAASGDVLYLSPAFAAIFGIDPAACLGAGSRWLAAIHPGDRGCVSDFLRHAASGAAGPIHFRALRPDGSVRWVEQSANPVREGDRVVRLTGTIVDITERLHAEEALRESEHKFRMLYDEAPDGLFILEAETSRVLDCNPTALALFDAAQRRDLVGRDGLLFPAGSISREEIDAGLRTVEQDGRFSVELEFESLAGRRFWGALVAQKLLLGGRRFTLVRLTDVTARRRLLELLADTQEIAHVGGWEYHVDEDRLVWTDEVYRICGLPIDEPVGLQRAFAFFTPESGRLLRDAFDEALRRGLPWRLDLQATRTDGSAVRVAVDGRAEFSGGRVSRLYGMMRDITQEHAAAAALREREEKLREQAMLLDAANDAIVLRSLDQTIRTWNQGAERLFGWSAAEAVGRKATELHLVPSEALDKETARVLEHGAGTAEMECVTKARKRILVQARWTLIRDAAGAPSSILAINTDITEKRRIEEQFIRAQRMESIGTLAGGIAHDLNNILAPIILSADMLQAGTLDPGDRDLVDTILASARRGAEVVRQVLSFARGVDSTRVPFNIRHLFSEFRKMARETFPRNITLEIEAPADLWNVFADPMQINQALLNLAVNARDAMPGGGLLRVEAANVEIDATFAGLAPDASPGPCVRVKVADTGTGIPPEIRKRIFDPFFTTKSVSQGTGLGLSTALAIVRGHGGFITVASEVGRGSTFALHIPAEHAQPRQQDLPPAADPARGRGELVLVIDDEESVRSIIRQGLEGAGYRAVTAADGAEGVALFTHRRSEVALVLTDLMMPVMDGAAAIGALRRLDPSVRVVAMSGIADAGSVAEPARPGGVLRFLLKPFSLESLLSTVHEAIAAPDAPAPRA
jgi:PAS domain S-box-containing protein